MYSSSDESLSSGECRLAVFVEDYPFNNGEPFFHQELIELQRHFQEIVIFCKHARTRKKNPPHFVLPQGVTLVELQGQPSPYSKGITFLKSALTGFADIRKDLRESGVPFRPYPLKVALAYQEAQQRIENEVDRWLKNHGKTREDFVWYTYWCDDSAYLLAKWKTQGLQQRVYSRVHNTDIYTERHPFKYLPFRRFIHQHLTGTLTISAHNRHYLWKKYPIASSHIYLHRLGVKEQEPLTMSWAEPIRLLTLSGVVPVKNLPFVAGVLGRKDLPAIEWHHIGAGSAEYQKQVLDQIALAQKENPSLQFHFHGFVSPTAVLEKVKEIQPHFLLNASLYEGIPVSMMEAASLGIPMLGPNITGVPEVAVPGKNAFLFSPEDSETLYQVLKGLALLSDGDFQRMCQHSLDIQRSLFNGTKNFSRLAQRLASGQVDEEQGWREVATIPRDEQKTRIAILQLGIGNVAAIENMLKSLKIHTEIVTRPSDIYHFQWVILPGVGAFDQAMTRLHQGNWPDALKQFVAQGGHLLGICLGMQLLMDGSEEGKWPGLGFIPGKVKKFPQILAEAGYAIPHMGWDRVQEENEGESSYYFTHSYYADPTDQSHVWMQCTYGFPFAAAIRHQTVMGVQFHPEKSHAYGKALFSRIFKEEMNWQAQRRAAKNPN